MADLIRKKGEDYALPLIVEYLKDENDNRTGEEYLLFLIGELYDNN
jgi:hypothetical protein